MAADEGLIGIKEVCALLGIGLSRYKDWRRDGHCPPGFFINGRHRYRRSEVLRWIEQHRV